jgi:hypothetical protein
VKGFPVTDVEKASSIEVYQPGEDWQSLTGRADELLGYDLARDETADDLVGVPFVVTRVVFRPGVLRDKLRSAYVSCEVRTSPNLNLRLINARRESSKLPRLTDLESLAFGPDSHVAFNDGSTGVYRQIVKLLTAKQYITLPTPVVEAGGYGESSFDQPPSEWTGILSGAEYTDDDNFVHYTANLALYCPRGLRLSLYQNDYTQTGKTRFLG